MKLVLTLMMVLFSFPVRALDMDHPANNVIVNSEDSSEKRRGSCGENLNSYECHMISLINRVRSAHHLKTLGLSRNCIALSRFQSGAMVKMSNGGAPLIQAVNHDHWLERVKKFQLNKGKVSENVAGGPYKHVEDVFKNWMNSEGHRANILDPKMKTTGVSVQHDRRGQPFWAQCFYSK